MKGACDENPSFPRCRGCNGEGETGVLNRVAGLVFPGDAIRADPERCKDFARNARQVGAPRYRNTKPAAATRENQPGFRVLQGQCCRNGQPFGGLVDLQLTPKLRRARILDAAEDDNPVNSSGVQAAETVPLAVEKAVRLTARC